MGMKNVVRRSFKNSFIPMSFKQMTLIKEHIQSLLSDNVDIPSVLKSHNHIAHRTLNPTSEPPVFWKLTKEFTDADFTCAVTILANFCIEI